MKKIMTKVIALSLMINVFNYTYASENTSTLCKKDEYTYISARMGKSMGTSYKKNGKILSICVDKEKEPFNKMIYRYGTLNNIELETIATPAQPFEISTSELDTHSGENVLSFKNNQYTYYIIQYIGMGSGISLKIYKSHKKILDLFSGNDKEKDYFTNNSVLIDFEKSKSLIFKNAMPNDNIDEFN